MSKDSLSDLIDKDQLRLLKQKMKALGIDDKCIKAGDVEELDFISREARLQDTTNRQNSQKLDLLDPGQKELAYVWDEKQRELIELAKNTYEWARFVSVPTSFHLVNGVLAAMPTQ
jgi:hypothetical protein